jgi:LuxR family maltose regulon positive regulatory protein
MTMSLVKTKLYIPPLCPQRITRPRLLRQLNEGLDRGHKLTLISAPAGFGKTTLLSEWAAHVARPVAWLSLDEDDNDPIRFLTYIIAALHQAHGEDKGPVPGPFALQPHSLPVQELLATCINDIDAHKGQIVLVLDDYHAIISSRIHEALTYLLDHLPRNLHLVIATRADPPLPIALLRGRGQLTELRQADLRFSTNEIEAFFCQLVGLELAAGDVKALAFRTEGWAAGLQLAALAAPTRADPAALSAFFATFTGRHEHFVDYFVDQVLAGQPDRIQAFLLHTSILDRLCGPLCDAVCGTPIADLEHTSAQQLLQQLQGANLFVVPLDNERQWYRYHHLFADLLRQRLLQSEADKIPDLHRRASRWYEQSGYLEQAIEHALLGKDVDRAATLIEQAAETVLMRGELVTLATWIKALPRDRVHDRPLLNLYYGAILLLKGKPLSKLQPYLQAAATDRLPDTATQGTVILRALLALWQGNVTDSIALGERALASLPEQNLFWRGIVTGNLGIAYSYEGKELDLAEAMLQKAAHIGERAGNVMSAVIALCNLAELRIVRGQLGAAETLYERALALAKGDREHPLPIGGIAIAGIASLLREWNKLGEAERILTTHLERTDKEMPIGVLASDVYLALAEIKASLGELEAAQAAIEQAQRAAASTHATVMDDRAVAVVQARQWIAQDRSSLAADWAKRHGLIDTAVDDASDAGPYVLYELERLTLAELWLAQAKIDRALDLLKTLVAQSRARQRSDTAIKALVLSALAHDAHQDHEQALKTTIQALMLAQPGGYVRTFVERGPRLAQLLRQALAQGVAVNYVRQLLAAFDPDATPPTNQQELIEPLSDRELQVLRLLATHLTNAEIGEQLFVSVNTVRFHARNIYSKLNVHTRGDAVKRAKELDLF